MNYKSIATFLLDRRAVSPVLGVALLIAITVILAGVIGFVVLGVNAGNADGPSASLTFSQENLGDTDGDTNDEYEIKLHHKGGDPIKDNNVVYRGSVTGAATGPANDMSTSSSDTITSGAHSGEVIRVVWQDPNSDREVLLAEYTVE